MGGYYAGPGWQWTSSPSGQAATTGSNQYGGGWQNINFPSPGGPQNPFGTGPSQYGGGFGTAQNPYSSTPSSGLFAGQTPGITGAGSGGYYTGTTYDPSLTSQLFGYLQSQIGQGLPAYPGQLTAPPNQLYQQIGNMLTGQASTLPYASQLTSMAQTGNPTDVGPAWNAMIAAQQQNIAQNLAQLKEQYAAGGNLVGTPYGTATQDYEAQTTAEQNALLAQMQQQASEAAAGRELTAQQGLTATGLSLGGQMQNINQTALTNAYNEWLRQQPQYNPLLGQAYGASTTFPPYLNPQTSPWLFAIPGIANILAGINWPKGGSSSSPTPTPAPIPGGGGSTGTPGTTPPTFPGGTTTTGGTTPTTPSGGQVPGWGSVWTPVGTPPGTTGTEGGIQAPPSQTPPTFDPTVWGSDPTVWGGGATTDPTTGQTTNPMTGLPGGQGTGDLQSYMNYLNMVYSGGQYGGGGQGMQIY